MPLFFYINNTLIVLQPAGPSLQLNSACALEKEHGNILKNKIRLNIHPSL